MTFLSRLSKEHVAALPAPWDSARVAAGRARLGEAAEAASPSAAAAIARCMDDPAGAALLAAVMGNSPHLTDAIVLNPDFFATVLKEGPEAARDGVLMEVAGLVERPPAEPELCRALRRAKARLALATALADISGLWDLEAVTGALTRFAEAALEAALAHALRLLARDDTLRPVGDHTGQRRGLFALGMGKLGARELNYSSDIDLILLYDPAAMPLAPGMTDPHQRIFRAVRAMVRVMDARTPDGYVFRVDLRLGPEQRATALTVDRAAAYYRGAGQVWERAAMIKARPVAGDREAGLAFLSRIRPFVWPESLDFAAIEDIHSVKRRINARWGGGRAPAGADGLLRRDIKKGFGGIRDVEFITQTHQLIHGGRSAGLRARGTLEALRRLRNRGVVPAADAAALSDAYVFLRALEHRLQMVADAQTQTLPDTAAGMARIARFMGWRDVGAFERAALARLRLVADQYASLFWDTGARDGAADGDGTTGGGAEEPKAAPRHPSVDESLLAARGFQDPAAALKTIQGWWSGDCRALRDGRARRLLAGMLPQLLRAMGDSGAPDAALARFDDFLHRIPSGVAALSLLRAERPLLNVTMRIMGQSGHLAEMLSRRPALLDAIAGEGAIARPDTDEAWSTGVLARGLMAALARSADYDNCLETARRWVREAKFRIGARHVRGALDAAEAAAALGAVAEALLRVLIPYVEGQFARDSGREIPGSGLAIVAFGKLGGGVLLPGSDLDLALLCEGGARDSSEDAAARLHTRLAQRILSVMRSASTDSGQLYAVDTRLRPHGADGPLVTSLAAFRDYYDLSTPGGAWVWEHMALTRARAVCGAPALRRRVGRAIHDALAQPRPVAETLRAVADMRRRRAARHPGKSLWDVRDRPGGLTDVEFIAQSLQLLHARAAPEVLSTDMARALDRLAQAGFLDGADHALLQDAHALWQGAQMGLRIAGGAPEGGNPALLWATGAESMAGLAARMDATAERVRAAFNRLICAPAGEEPL